MDNVGWKPIDTTIPELLSNKYRLRKCEAIEKDRLLEHGKDIVGFYIYIRGKGDFERKVHVMEKDYQKIIDYYKDPKTISGSTLYNRLLPTAKKYPGQTNKSVTHRPRKDVYEELPEDAILEDFVALGEELGHSIKVVMQHYNRTRINIRKRKLPHLRD